MGEPLTLAVGVIALIGLGLTFFGGHFRLARLRKQDALRDLHREIAAAEASPDGRLRAIEVRLYDYGREVEGRIDTRLTALDELIVEADLEIARLEALLAESRVNLPAERQLSADEQQRCFALWEAGISVSAIARCLHATPGQVQTALDEFRQPRRDAA